MIVYNKANEISWHWKPRTLVWSSCLQVQQSYRIRIIFCKITAMEKRCNNSEASSTNAYEMTNAIADSRNTDYGTIIINGKRSGDWNKSYLKDLSFGLVCAWDWILLLFACQLLILNWIFHNASELMSYNAAAHNTEMPYQFSAKKKPPNYTDCIAPVKFTIYRIYFYIQYSGDYLKMCNANHHNKGKPINKSYSHLESYIFTLSRVCCSLREFMQHLHSIILENGLTAHGERFLYTRPIFSQSTWFVLLYWLWHCIRSFWNVHVAWFYNWIKMGKTPSWTAFTVDSRKSISSKPDAIWIVNMFEF